MIRGGGFLLVALLGIALAVTAQAPAPVPAPAPAPANTFLVPQGEKFVLELQDYLHTRSSQEGDTAHFVVHRTVRAGGQLVVPSGSAVRATLTKVKRPGRLRGRAEIRLRFEEVELPDGTVLPFRADIVRAGLPEVDNDEKSSGVKGEGNAGRDAVQVGVSGAQGALLGAAIGGKKGAAYGGAIGAGIGLLGILLERGPELSIPPGMLFQVELQEALAVPVAATRQFARRPSAPAPGPAGRFQFPDDPDHVTRREEPEIPDFEEEESDPTGAGNEPAEQSAKHEKDETTEVAVNRPSVSTPPPSAGSRPPAPARDPTLSDPEAYKIRVNVRLVLVEAFVRDARGRPMDELGREDFRLFEDGVKQEIRHFSRDELPLAVALVVDRSNSVAAYMPELRHAAYETLQRLKSGDQVALFAFDSRVHRLEDLTTDRRRIAERIARIRTGGDTNLLDALYDASHYLSIAAPERQRAIILISDNVGTVDGRASQEDVIRLGLEEGVVIYSIKTPGHNRRPSVFGLPMPTIDFGTGDVDDLTRETGGEVLDVEESGSLRAALAAVVSRLKTRYTLGYSSSNPKGDGGFREIEVRLAERFGRHREDYTVHARKGYYASDQRVAQEQPNPQGR